MKEFSWNKLCKAFNLNAYFLRFKTCFTDTHSYITGASTWIELRNYTFKLPQKHIIDLAGETNNISYNKWEESTKDKSKGMLLSTRDISKMVKAIDKFPHRDKGFITFFPWGMYILERGGEPILQINWDIHRSSIEFISFPLISFVRFWKFFINNCKEDMFCYLNKTNFYIIGEDIEGGIMRCNVPVTCNSDITPSTIDETRGGRDPRIEDMNNGEYIKGAKQ